MNTVNQRLMRSRYDKMIAGVAGGIGHYFAVDPVVVRVVFVMLVFIHGIGLLAYPILWVVMPREPEDAPDTPTAHPPGTSGRMHQAPSSHAFVGGSRARASRFDPMTGQPLDPDQEIPIQNLDRGGSPNDAQIKRNWLLGATLVVLGFYLVLQALFPSIAPFVVAVLLVAAGFYLLRRSG